MEAQAPRRRRQPRRSRRPTVYLHATAAKPMAERPDNECDRTTARRVQAANQNADRVAVGRYRGDVVLGVARIRPDQHAKGRWLADARHKAHRSANRPRRMTGIDAENGGYRHSGLSRKTHQRASYWLASLDHACRNLVPAFPQRSPPRLLSAAACGGLRSAPDCRTRRALLHLSYSCACRLDRRCS